MVENLKQVVDKLHAILTNKTGLLRVRQDLALGPVVEGVENGVSIQLRIHSIGIIQVSVFAVSIWEELEKTVSKAFDKAYKRRQNFSLSVLLNAEKSIIFHLGEDNEDSFAEFSDIVESEIGRRRIRDANPTSICKELEKKEKMGDVLPEKALAAKFLLEGRNGAERYFQEISSPGSRSEFEMSQLENFWRKMNSDR